MPPNTVKVDRTSKYGNPHHWRDWLDSAQSLKFYLPYADERKRWAQEMAAEAFAEDARDGNLPDLTPLRGKNLACWCPLGRYCHADVLLEMALRDSDGSPKGGDAKLGSVEDDSAAIAPTSDPEAAA